MKVDGSSEVKGFTLVVPSVGVANVGQMGLELLLNTLLDDQEGKQVQVVRAGRAKSRFVMPMVGIDPLVVRGEPRARMCSNLELFAVPQNKLVFMQIRAPIVEGKAAAFAAELCEFVKENELKSIVVLGGADSGASAEEEVMFRKFRYAECHGSTPELLERMKKIGIPPLDPGQYPTSVNGFTIPLNICKAGLTTHLYSQCLQSEIPFLAVVLFTKEGDNIDDAYLMTSAAISIFNVFPSMPSRLVQPKSFQYLDGGNPEITLFQ